MLVGIGLDGNADGAELQLGGAFFHTVLSGDRYGFDAEQGSLGDGLSDVVERTRDTTILLADADDCAMGGSADALQNFMDVALAVEEVNQTWSLDRRQVVQGCLGRLDA